MLGFAELRKIFRYNIFKKYLRLYGCRPSGVGMWVCGMRDFLSHACVEWEFRGSSISFRIVVGVVEIITV